MAYTPLLDSRDANHAHAVELFRTAPRRVTHSYILSELIALARARRLSIKPVLDFVAELQQSPLMTIIWVDQSLHLEAFRLLQDRLDKSYSLCDAVSFVVMQRERETDALTTDHHFEQEGFAKHLGR